MDRAPEMSAGRDVLTDFVESGLRSAEAFATYLDVPTERVEYWLSLAELKRQRTEACRCD